MRQTVPYANCGVAGSIFRNNYWSKDREVAVFLNKGRSITSEVGQRWVFPDGSIIARNGRQWSAAMEGV